MAGEGGAAVLQVLVQNLIDLSENEISRIRGLGGEAQNLIQNLNTIQKFLNKAETRSIPTGDVKSWLQRLENAAFEADNVLDELHYHSLSKTINKKEKVLISCFSPFVDYARKRKIGVSIKEINKDLKSINQTATELGLQKILADAPYASMETDSFSAVGASDAGMETDSFSADPIFIGRDEDVSKIVKTLITSVVTDHYERVFSILPIVGMGGSGKTTVTRRVFHHERIQTHFGTRIWVHVSQVFDPINLFNKILKELMTSSQSHQGEISRQEILKKLEEALKDKTYLLVLDNIIWNQDLLQWKDFLDSLSGVTSTKGNGIILTTRNKEVASIVRPLPIHPLKDLSVEDCWSIISAKAFGKESVPSGFDESVRIEIAERCGGLPLAASVIGGVLRRDKSVDTWVSIRDNWLPEGEGEGAINIKKILRLSFNNLSSPSLKKCFAYCSIFPKGKEMAKDKLIEMWMAEGFLGSEDMESVGEKFYNVLLHSSLLQEANAKVKILGFKPCKVERCVMHNLAHDLASSVLGSVNKADDVSQVRYLIQQGQIKKEVAQHLRTLISRADQLFSDFNSLHVLTLKRGTFQELPISIKKLIHLRSLSISLTVIKHLPDWIGELHHLQTLRAPYMIEKLPSTIKYLINLRHLHIPNAELPAEIGRLTSLQTLSTPFIVRDENGYKIEELGSLNNLKGSLTIGCLEKVHDKEEAEKANLFKKSKLSELWLWWSITYCREEVERNDENVLEGLQPHSDLKKLQIEGFDGKRFPEWTLEMAVRNEPQGPWIGLNQLVEIKFYGCRECEEIPMLGHLPNLKSLYLRDLNNVKSINSSFYGIGNETSSGFRKLETLELIYMPSLKEWAEVESGSTSEGKVFPNLKSLRISYCNQLTKAPIHAFSSGLKSLRISYCNQLTQHAYLPLLTLLTYLVLEGLNGLESLPDKLFYNYPNLIVLKISKCSKLREIPDGLQTLNSLKELIISQCPDLKRIGCSSGGRLTSLYELEISDCDGLVDIPDELLESSSDQVLKKVTLRGLKSLSTLPWPKPSSPTELETVEVEAWHFPNLYKLEIDVSMEGSRETSVATKKAVNRILQGCSSLRWLYLTGMEIWESLPESIQYLTSLDSLELNNFGMEELPEWFDGYISDIMSPSFSLKLSNCKRLRRLPSTEAMSRLIEAQNVVIEGCPEFHMNNNNIVLNSQDFLPTVTVELPRKN